MSRRMCGVARGADEVAKAMVIPPHGSSLDLHASGIGHGDGATTAAQSG